MSRRAPRRYPLADDVVVALAQPSHERCRDRWRQAGRRSRRTTGPPSAASVAVLSQIDAAVAVRTPPGSGRIILAGDVEHRTPDHPPVAMMPMAITGPAPIAQAPARCPTGEQSHQRKAATVAATVRLATAAAAPRRQARTPAGCSDHVRATASLTGGCVGYQRPPDVAEGAVGDRVLVIEQRQTHAPGPSSVPGSPARR